MTAPSRLPRLPATAERYASDLNRWLAEWHDEYRRLMNATRGPAYQSVANGFSVTLTDDVDLLILAPSGTVSSGTITLPPRPENGAIVRICWTAHVTGLTIAPNAGQAVSDAAPVTDGAGIGYAYRSSSGDAAWYRLY